jgi:peptidoglycan/LPS O-acetylase OafA/YrhL
LAAFTVVAFHWGYDLKSDGVTAFFVLSGFLITSLLMREYERTGRISLQNFYLRRTLRIFPAYYCFVAFSRTVDAVAGNPWPNGLFASAIGYMVNYYNAFTGHPSTSVAHAWSLGVEEQFYLMWPVCFSMLARRGMPTVRKALVGAIVAAFLWRLILVQLDVAGKAYLYNAFDARLDNLAIGCLLATMAREPRYQGIAKVLSGRMWAPLVTLAGMAAVPTLLSGSIWRHIIGFSAYSALVAILLVQVMILSAASPWRWLNSRPMRYLGDVSYPTYLYHVWAVGAVHKLDVASGFLGFGVSYAVTILAAAASFHLVERPFLRLKDRLASLTHGSREKAESAGSAALGGASIGPSEGARQ